MLYLSVSFVPSPELLTSALRFLLANFKSGLDVLPLVCRGTSDR